MVIPARASVYGQLVSCPQLWARFSVLPPTALNATSTAIPSTSPHSAPSTGSDAGSDTTTAPAVTAASIALGVLQQLESQASGSSPAPVTVSSSPAGADSGTSGRPLYRMHELHVDPLYPQHLQPLSQPFPLMHLDLAKPPMDNPHWQVQVGGSMHDETEQQHVDWHPTSLRLVVHAS